MCCHIAIYYTIVTITLQSTAAMLNPQPSTRPLQLLVCPCLPRRQAHVERPDRCTLEQLKVRSTALELILKPFLDT